MITDRTRTITQACYGLAIIASGIYRYYSASGGTNGLGFGVVMGSVALIAAALLALRFRIIGQIVAWLSIGIVGAWFCYELKSKYAQPRIWLILACTAAQAVVMCLPVRSEKIEQIGYK